MTVKPIPDGYHTITPYIVVKDAPKFIEFLKKAFDATECHPPCLNEGLIMHAELKIGDSIIMLGEARDEHGHGMAAGGSKLYLYVKDTDHYYHKALKAGATSLMEPADQFYGDRNAGVQDAFGNSWWIATHIEDVSSEEVTKRAATYHQK